MEGLQFCVSLNTTLYLWVGANAKVRVVREMPRDNDDGTSEPKFKIVIKSEYLLKACKDVIQSWPGISWNADPLEVRIAFPALHCRPNNTNSSVPRFASPFWMSLNPTATSWQQTRAQTETLCTIPMSYPQSSTSSRS